MPCSSPRLPRIAAVLVKEPRFDAGKIAPVGAESDGWTAIVNRAKLRPEQEIKA